jgi:hypothetical protein
MVVPVVHAFNAGNNMLQRALGYVGTHTGSGIDERAVRPQIVDHPSASWRGSLAGSMASNSALRCQSARF